MSSLPCTQRSGNTHCWIETEERKYTHQKCALYGTSGRTVCSLSVVCRVDIMSAPPKILPAAHIPGRLVPKALLCCRNAFGSIALIECLVSLIESDRKS